MFRYIVVIIALFLLQACASNAEQQAQRESETKYSAEQLGKYVGVLNGLKYINPSVPVKLSLPKDWFLTLQDKQIIAIDGTAEDLRLDPLVRNSYRMLYLLKYKELPAGKLNISLIFMASDNSQYVKSTTAEAHNQRIKAGLKKSGRDYRFDRESYNKNLAQREFNILPSVVHLASGVQVFQEYHTSIKDERLITFILTYTNDEDRKSLEKIMKTAKFK